MSRGLHRVINCNEMTNLTELLTKKYLGWQTEEGARKTVEEFAEYLLHGCDVLTNADLSAKLVFQVGGSCQMIGMDMRFQMPAYLDGQCVDAGTDGIRGCRGSPAGLGIEIQHAVDDGVVHSVGNGADGA